VVAVFHTDAGHVRLHDGAYNADWNVATANPYKELLADLRKHGVQLELCGRLRRLTTGERGFAGIKINRNAWREARSSVTKGNVNITE
jgi:hypothetical protein